MYFKFSLASIFHHMWRPPVSWIQGCLMFIPWQPCIFWKAWNKDFFAHVCLWRDREDGQSELNVPLPYTILWVKEVVKVASYSSVQLQHVFLVSKIEYDHVLLNSVLFWITFMINYGKSSYVLICFGKNWK